MEDKKKVLENKVAKLKKKIEWLLEDKKMDK